MSRSYVTRILTVIVAALSLAGLSAVAQEPASAPAEQVKSIDLDSYLGLVRADLRTQKRGIVTASMDLTEKEAQGFWPVYDNYERDVMKLGDKKLALIKSFADKYETLDDAQAKDLSMKSFELQKKRAALKEKYFAEFAKVIPARKAARFFQVDNRIDLLVDIQISKEIPLAK